ncbi:MAG: hypothetical protein WBB45_02545 [Cyclobacteriaceae bacterium]
MQIKHLNTLRPAEVLFFLNGKKLPVGKLIFTTMMDMVFRNILMINEGHEQSHATETPRKVFTVGTGSHFSSYHPAKYEQPIYRLWNGNTKKEFYIKTMVKGVYNMYPDEGHWHKAVREEMAHYISDSWTAIFFSFPLNEEGELVKEQLLSELEWINTKMRITLPDEQQAEIIASIGANVFMTRLSVNLPAFHRAYTMKDYWKDVRNENLAGFFLEPIAGAGFDTVGDVFSGLFDNISFDFDWGG